MKAISAADVATAIRRYDAGLRPFRHTPSRAWYLVTSRGRVYPLKYLYALAVGKTPSSFHTVDAIRAIQRLKNYDVRRQPKDAEIEFQRRVKNALKDPKRRAARLLTARTLPRTVIREIVTYERNPDVVAEILSRARGRCELCGKLAPFVRRTDKTPYLEIHHTKRLADGGEDTVANAIAACPNCHRQAHHG